VTSPDSGCAIQQALGDCTPSVTSMYRNRIFRDSATEAVPCRPFKEGFRDTFFARLVHVEVERQIAAELKAKGDLVMKFRANVKAGRFVIESQRNPESEVIAMPSRCH